MPDVYLRPGEATPADVRLRPSIAYVTGTGAMSQAAQTMTASGTVTAAAPPVVAPVAHGAGRRRRQRIERVVLWPLAPRPVSGVASTRQGRQWVYAVGIVQQMVGGAAASRQAPQAMEADGVVDTRRRDERDLIEILMLLDAA